MKKKKIIKFVFIVILFLFFNKSVFAEKAKYIYDDDYYLIVDKENRTDGAGEYYYKIIDFDIPLFNESISSQELILAIPQTHEVNNAGIWWNTTYVCKYYGTGIKYIFDGQKIDVYFDYSETPEQKDLNLFAAIFNNNSTCYSYKLDKTSVTNLTKVDDTCSTYDDLLIEINNLDKKSIQSYNESLNKLNSFCKFATENLNYDESCVKRCTRDLPNDKKKFDSKFGISSNTINDCGLSNNIVNWIKNILKWIKYILPVLVIILGILDFIKAISSGSDDEMKKAQGRFVKRLIAAALLFIIPAIIEFVLTIFKIESTFCGIIGK